MLNLAKPVEFSAHAEPDSSRFPAWCSQLSKTNPNAKTVLVQLVFPINVHQNANQRPIGSAPAYHVQCTLPPQPIYQTLPPFRFFEGLVPRLGPAQLCKLQATESWAGPRHEARLSHNRKNIHVGTKQCCVHLSKQKNKMQGW